MSQKQLYLFKTRRFLPLFVTQFLGAFNDNAFRFALLFAILATSESADEGRLTGELGRNALSEEGVMQLATGNVSDPAYAEVEVPHDRRPD